MIGPTNAITITGTIDPGSVTVGSDTKPIKLVGGVATAVTNDLVDTATTQTIGGTKTFTGENGFNIQNDGASGHYAINLKDTVLEKDVNPSTANYPFYIRILDKNDVRLADPMGVRFNNNGSGQIDFVTPRINGSVGSPDFQILNGYVCAKSRTYSASNTYDVVTISSLQASTDVVHTSGNETIAGLKKVSALGASAGAIYVTTSQSVDVIRTSLGTANYTYHIPIMWGTHYDGGFAMLSITVTAGMPTAISSVDNSPVTKQTKFGARKEDDYLVISMTPAGNTVMSAMAFGCSRGSGVYTGEDMSVYGTINTTSSLQNYVQEV